MSKKEKSLKRKAALKSQLSQSVPTRGERGHMSLKKGMGERNIGVGKRQLLQPSEG